jgi:hypothetical protein
MPLAETIEAVLRDVQKAAVREDLGPKVKEQLEKIRISLQDAAERTKEVEQLIKLETAQAELPSGMEHWIKFKPGPQRDRAELERFVRSSSLLNNLFRKGIDIHNAYKFSKDQFQLARQVGDKFSAFSGPLSGLRRNRKDDEKPEERTALFPCEPESGEFARFLEKSNILKFKKFLIRNKEDQWKPFKVEWFSKSQDTSVLSVFQVTNPESLRFLQGEWLNAYVYTIMQDHFSRNQAKFELYTNISYRAPADVIRIAGEFDVIGRLGNRPICVECKSGRLLNESGLISSIVGKITDLKKALDFEAATASDYIFYLIFDPTQNDEKEVRAQMEGSGIKALKPDQVRAEITRLF